MKNIFKDSLLLGLPIIVIIIVLVIMLILQGHSTNAQRIKPVKITREISYYEVPPCFTDTIQMASQGACLETVLRFIADQFSCYKCELYASYKIEDVKPFRRIVFPLKGRNLHDTMKVTLAHTNLDFILTRNRIIVFRKGTAPWSN